MLVLFINDLRLAAGCAIVYCVHISLSGVAKSVSHAIEFIETSVFSKEIKLIASDDELKDLQVELIAQPEKGDLIQGTGGLRKVRMATDGQGKSGGARVIYFLATAEIIYLVLAYPKNAKDHLSNSEKSELKKLVKFLKGEM